MQPPNNGEAPRRTEEILEASEERFRLLVEGVKDYAIFMLDPQGHIVSWNSGAERMKGYRAEEIIGKPFSVFYTEEDLERGHPEEELRIATAEGAYEEEGIRVRKDGSRFWASVLIAALRDAEGNLRGFTKVTRDITTRKEAEERERLLAREQAAREQATDILESISDAQPFEGPILRHGGRGAGGRTGAGVAANRLVCYSPDWVQAWKSRKFAHHSPRNAFRNE